MGSASTLFKESSDFVRTAKAETAALVQAGVAVLNEAMFAELMLALKDADEVLKEIKADFELKGFKSIFCRPI